jgi:hypothetical protein
MNTLTKLGIILGMVGMISYAETWTGRLIDAQCYDSKATATSAGQKSPASSGEKLDRECAPTAATTNYALHADNKVYKLDSSGNAKVATEMQSGALKLDKDGDLHATVSGSVQGDTVKVDTIKVSSKNK